MSRILFVVAAGVALAVPVNLQPAAVVSATPGPALSYFTNVRDIHISQPGQQNYFVVDEEIWSHARPDLGDLRIYDGEAQVQYALTEQRAGTSSHEEVARILNLGKVGEHTEFDLDMGQIAEYDRIRLQLDAKNFVVTASLAGSNALGGRPATQLPPATLYDFTREELGSNYVLKLPASSFRYLHVQLSAGISPQQVKGRHGLQPAGDQGKLEQRGIVRDAIADAANYSDQLRMAAKSSGGSRSLSGGSQADKLPAGGHPYGIRRPVRKQWRDHASAAESRGHNRGVGRDGCSGRGTNLRPDHDYGRQRGQPASGDRGGAVAVRRTPCLF